MKSSWETDLVLSFMGSVTFWLTVLGFAFRRLRIDMQQLEQYLKAIYQDIDTFRIDYWQWTRIALQRTFTAIYGQPGHARFIYVVAAATISMNGFGLIAIHRDWQHRKDEISAILRESYKIEPQYAALMSVANGRLEIKRAFETTLILPWTPAGGNYEEVYTYTDQHSSGGLFRCPR